MAEILSNCLDDAGSMKCTLAITQRCNLSCDYCYIKKKNSLMSIQTASRAINFIFKNSYNFRKIDINFFGGEPLLEFELIKKITNMIYVHPSFNRDRVGISVVTNGTIFSKEISDFLIENEIVLCISCDGPQKVQDAFRHFPDGRGSSSIVEKNIKQVVRLFPLTPINAVYSPENLQFLPQVVDYLTSLGVRNLYLSPNISANWKKKDIELLPTIYDAIGQKYINFYLNCEPRYISLIDGKIGAILRGGYKPFERCRMGKGEFAFGPSGNIYPCERLIGADEENEHCLGNLDNGFFSGKICKEISNVAINKECQVCGLKDYCMNWCGCTNYHSTGNYNIVSPFVCASEKASINTAFNVFQSLVDIGLDLSHHLSGTPLMNVISGSFKERKNS